MGIDLLFGQHWTFGKGGGGLYTKIGIQYLPGPLTPPKRLFKFEKNKKTIIIYMHPVLRFFFYI